MDDPLGRGHKDGVPHPPSFHVVILWYRVDILWGPPNPPSTIDGKRMSTRYVWYSWYRSIRYTPSQPMSPIGTIGILGIGDMDQYGCWDGKGVTQTPFVPYTLYTMYSQ